MKLRHYGLLAPGNVNGKLLLAKRLLEDKSGRATAAPVPQSITLAEDWRALLLRRTGIDVTRCPLCNGPLVSRPLSAATYRDSS